MSEHFMTIVTATGALGVAAFGVAEGLKRIPWIGEAGFSTIRRILGRNIFDDMLTVAYGTDVEKLMRALYRGEQGELVRVIRQGVRIGLTTANASDVANAVGFNNEDLLKDLVSKLNAGEELSPEERNVLGRFELAVDVRIDAAITLAQNKYADSMRLTAAVIAVGVALVVGYKMSMLPVAAVVGFLAVPLAPVAKDVVTALRSASEALRARS